MIPDHCKVKSTAKSMQYAVFSMSLVLVCFVVGRYIPLSLWALPLWIAYWAVSGTVVTGLWVVAHECGHGAFSDNKLLQVCVSGCFCSRLDFQLFSSLCLSNALLCSIGTVSHFQDAVGYILHSVVLVPYFSWQRSHAVHHSRTNHVTEGETHVPYTNLTSNGAGMFLFTSALHRIGVNWLQGACVKETSGESRNLVSSTPFNIFF